MADRVNVITPGGETANVDKSELSDAVAAGFRPLTPAQTKAFKLEEKYGTFESVAGPAVAGLTRGMTFGLSDPAIIEANRFVGKLAGVGGDEQAAYARETLNDYKEMSPGISKVSEFAGSAVPFVATGGLGGTVSKGVSRAFGEQATKGILGRSLVGGITGAAEMAPFGAGEAISEAALGNHDITAQKVLGSAGVYSLWGAGLGGTFGALGGAIDKRRAARAAAETSPAIAEAMPVATEGTLGAATGKAPKPLSQWLEEQHGQSVFRAAGANKRLAREAERYAGGPAEVGRIWDQEMRAAGIDATHKMDPDAWKELAGGMKERSGATLGKIRSALDADPATMAARPTVGDLFADVDTHIQQLRKQALPTSSLESFLENAKAAVGADDAVKGWKKAQISFQELFDLQQGASRLASYNNLAEVPAVKDAFRQIEYSFRKRLEDATDLVIDSAGKSAKSEYMQAKKVYQAGIMLEKAAEESTARTSSNALLSLFSKIGGSAGAAAGALIGGPIGSLVGGGLGIGAASVVNRYGEGLMADGLRFVAKQDVVRSIAKGAAKTDVAIKDGVGSFLGAATPKAAIVPIESTAIRNTRNEYNTKFAVVAQMANNPAWAADRIARNLGTLPTTAPNMAAALSAKAAQVASFLYAQAPKSHTPKFALQPVPSTIPDDAMAQWLRTAHAATNPLTVIERMKDGKLSRGEAHAVRTLYPDLFAQIQQEVMGELAIQTQKGKVVSYDKRIQLGTLFGMPTDRTLDPSFIKAIQATYGQSNQPEQPATPNGKAIEVAESYSSAGDKLEQ